MDLMRIFTQFRDEAEALDMQVERGELSMHEAELKFDKLIKKMHHAFTEEVAQDFGALLLKKPRCL